MGDIVDVLKAIMGAQYSTAERPFDHAMTVWRYNDKEHFRILWTNIREAKGVVWIVWDRTPLTTSFGHAEVTPHLSPLHWAAVAAKLAAAPFALHIIDLAQREHRNTCPLYEEFQHYKDGEFPFIRIYQPQELLDSSRMLDGSRSLPTESEPEPQHVLRLLELAASLMFRETERDSRHSLSNALGPLFLMGNRYFEDLEQDAHVIALRALLTALGFSSLLQEKHVVLRFRDQGNSRVLLIDDLSDFGWQKWLEQNFDPASTDVLSFGTAAEILQTLDTLIHCRASAYLATVEQAPSVYFVDLRLFPATDAGANEEVNFFKALLRLWEKVPIDDTQLAWDSERTKALLREVGAWLTDISDTQNENTADRFSSQIIQSLADGEEYRMLARLVLPVILSQLDPLAPIILFSSSTDRNIVEFLKPFGSIYTSFSKPVFWGRTASEALNQARLGLERVVEDSSALLRVRDCFAAIMQSRDPKASNGLASNGQRLHVELYIDESGKGKNKPISRVGGVLVVYRGEDPLALSKKFEDLAVASGLCYFSDRAKLYPGGLKNELKKQDAQGCANALRKALEAMPDRGNIIISPVWLDAFGENDDRREHADIRYWKLIRKVVELFIAESLPQIARSYGVSDSEISYSIFAGTRAKPRPDSPRVRRDYRAGFYMTEQRDSDTKQIVPMMQTLAHHDVYWIVRHAEERHGKGVHSYRPERECGIPIQYGHLMGVCPLRFDRYSDEVATEQLPNAVETFLSKIGKAGERDKVRYDIPALLYVADELLTNPNQFVSRGVVKFDAPGSFCTCLDQSLQRTIDASVALDTGHKADAIAAFGHCNEGESGARAMVARRLAIALQTQFKGADILRAKSLLAPA